MAGSATDRRHAQKSLTLISEVASWLNANAMTVLT